MATAEDITPVMETFSLDNSGNGPLQVPDFSDIPLDYDIPSEDRFAHGHDEWYQAPGGTVREMAMVAAMNFMTDKPNWHIDIFDDAIAESWRADAEATFPRFTRDEWPKEVRGRVLLTQKAWEWCLQELRDKAEEFKQKQFVRVLDTGSCVCKSDTIVLNSCAGILKAKLSEFYCKPRIERLTPQKDGMLDIVDPCLYPLVYGKTPVLQDEQTFGLKPRLEDYGQTKLAPKHEDLVDVDPDILRHIEEGQPSSRISRRLSSSPIPWDAYRWSSKFQWLPCEVEFVGQTATEVRISSYINNLHPKHVDLYNSLEILLTRCIGLWNGCIVKGIIRTECATKHWHRRCPNDQRQRGRLPLRIVSLGIQPGIRIPDWAINFDERFKRAVRHYVRRKNHIDKRLAEADVSPRDLRKLRKDAKNLKEQWKHESGGEKRPRKGIPSPTPSLLEEARDFLESPAHGGQTLPPNWKDDPFRQFESLAHGIQGWNHPEPGDAVSYADWRAGKEEQFRAKGLQVIVKIGGIESSPRAPVQTDREVSEGWQVPGRLNEHIAATAIYVYDTVNIQESHIEFRQVMDINYNCYHYSEKYPDGCLKSRLWPITDQQDIVMSMLNIKHRYICTTCDMVGVPAFQEVGKISMPEDRLFAFPNIMEHRFAPLQLVDKTLPGHCRFVTFHLVDPHYRICSTRNVPPQQHAWWSEEVSDLFTRLGLPREIADQICSAAEDWPMGDAEALLHRDQQLRERKFMDVARWHRAGIH